MSILGSVTAAPPRAGIRMVVAGVEKIGKTTLLASAPRPLLVPMEQGYQGVQMHSTPLLSHYDHVMSLLDEVTAEAQARRFQYGSLCFDSITAFERFIHQKVLESDPTYGKGNKKALTMESALGGYGKAYQYANELFSNFLAKCDALAQYGQINIVFTCHVFASEVIDPQAGVYNSMDLLLHSPKNQKTYGKRELLTQWADVVGYLHEPVIVTENERTKFAMGVSKGQGRVFAMNRTPAYVAGNRFGVTKDIPLPAEKGWNHIAQAIYEAKGLDYYNRDQI